MTLLAPMLCDRAIEAAAAAGTARPQRALPLVLASRAHLLKAEILERHGGDPEFELAEALRLARDADGNRPGEHRAHRSPGTDPRPCFRNRVAPKPVDRR